MLNIAVALLCGALTWAALALPHLLRPSEAILPSAGVTIFGAIFLARRSFRQLEAIMQQGAGALQHAPPNFDHAIATMERGYRLAPYQLGIRTQVDTQIGMIYFLQKEPNRALPYLKRSLLLGHWMGGAMLGVIYYKKRDHAQMRKTFEVVCRRAKKQGLAWCLYAYLLVQIGDKEAALRILSDGEQAAKDDARVGEARLALQNDKRIKMKAFKEQWYQFQLERPPLQMQMRAGNTRMSRTARRGRW